MHTRRCRGVVMVRAVVYIHGGVVCALEAARRGGARQIDVRSPNPHRTHVGEGFCEPRASIGRSEHPRRKDFGPSYVLGWRCGLVVPSYPPTRNIKTKIGCLEQQNTNFTSRVKTISKLLLTSMELVLKAETFWYWPGCSRRRASTRKRTYSHTWTFIGKQKRKERRDEEVPFTRGTFPQRPSRTGFPLFTLASTKKYLLLVATNPGSYPADDHGFTLFTKCLCSSWVVVAVVVVAAAFVGCGR